MIFQAKLLSEKCSFPISSQSTEYWPSVSNITPSRSKRNAGLIKAFSQFRIGCIENDGLAVGECQLDIGRKLHVDIQPACTDVLQAEMPRLDISEADAVSPYLYLRQRVNQLCLPYVLKWDGHAVCTVDFKIVPFDMDFHWTGP